MFEQRIADGVQTRQAGAAIIMIKQFTQTGTRLQPIMGLQFAAGGDHAAIMLPSAAAESIY